MKTDLIALFTLSVILGTTLFAKDRDFYAECRADFKSAGFQSETVTLIEDRLFKSKPLYNSQFDKSNTADTVETISFESGEETYLVKVYRDSERHLKEVQQWHLARDGAYLNGKSAIFGTDDRKCQIRGYKTLENGLRDATVPAATQHHPSVSH